MIEVFSLVCAALAFTPAPPAEFVGSRMFAASVAGDRIAGIGGDGVPVQSVTNAALDGPRGVAFGPDGRLYATSGDHVLVFDGAGKLLDTLGTAAGLSGARGIAIGPSGDLFVTSLTQVIEMKRDGTFVRAIGAADGMHVPVGLCFGSDGHLFVTLAGDNAIAEYDSNFHRVNLATPTELAIPMGIAFAPNGLLYVSSFFNGSVLAFDASGAVVATFTDPSLLFPSGITIGPNGNLFVAAFFGNSILEFSAVGTKIREIAMPTGATNPEGIAFAPYRLKAKLTGRLAIDGGSATNVDENAIVSFAPGSRTLMLQLTDKATSKDIASSLGIPSMVFHGFESGETADAKNRLAQGVELTLDPNAALGIGAIAQASLVLNFAGKSKSFGTSPAFQPKSATGTLQRSSSTGSFRGAITTSAVLN